jgi:heme-degrading monooxygenase HmoA
VILRVFRVSIPAGRHQEWRDLVKHESMPALSRTDGLLAFWAGEPVDEGDEFTMVTLWRDLDAVRAFTGGDYHDIVMLGEETDFAAEAGVEHFRIFGSKH